LKRIKIFLLVIGLFSSFLAGCSLINPSSPPTKVKIGTAATYQPFEFLNAGYRQITGFDVDLMKAIGTAANLDIEFVNSDYNRLITAVAQCQLVDGMISAIPITENLKKEMDFSTPYYSLGQVIIVQKGNITVTGVDTLSGSIVGVQSSTASERVAAKINGIELRLYKKYTLAFDDLINGFIDAIVTDKITALSYANEALNNLKIAGKEIGADDLGIAVCNQNPDLLQKINAGLKVVKSNGTLDKLIKKWLANPAISNMGG
jgi:glutamine transport system substrate-binding protein